MYFSATTSGQGLIQDCETLTGLGKNAISGNGDKLKEFTRLINNWYRKADTWIWKAAGDWDFDDSNYTTLPVGTTDLTAAQHDYALPSSARKVERVEVLDNDSNYQLVEPIDKSEITDEAMSEYEETDGLPLYYDIVGNSLYLYPAPAAANVTETAGLKLYCSRDINEFASTNTSTSAGFDNHFHTILSKGASYDWCVAKGLPKAQAIRAELSQLESEIEEFYGSRHRNFKTRFGIMDESNI